VRYTKYSPFNKGGFRNPPPPSFVKGGSRRRKKVERRGFWGFPDSTTGIRGILRIFINPSLPSLGKGRSIFSPLINRLK